MTVFTIQLPLFNRFSIVLFLLGLALHTTVFIQPHHEGDELIYQALVQQLASGKGYTLQGTKLLEEGYIDKQIYDQPIFFHPPGGMFLFWGLQTIFGPFGFPIAQLLAYALFFWATLYIGQLLKLCSKIEVIIMSCLTAFSPIMAHVGTKYWLDGPLLAFSTLSVVLFLKGSCSNKKGTLIMAGIVLGFSGLIKVTAFFITPALALFVLLDQKQRKVVTTIKTMLYFILPALIMQLPWIIWQWIALGTPMTTAAGNPQESLINSNRYIYYVTVVRSPFIYLTLLPRIMWTLIPSIFLLALQIRSTQLKKIGAVMIFWIATILIIHIALGFVGYSKVIRYLILLTPAAILLFTSTASATLGEFSLNSKKVTMKTATVSLVVIISAAAFLLEIFTGMRESCVLDKALIVPFGGF